MKTFFISDLHFGHARVIEYDNRPYTTVEEMDADIVSRWNAVVKPTDCVYILGDLGLCTSMSKADKVAKTVSLLHGDKRLIRGNHDVVLTSSLRACFTSICEIANVKVEGKELALCHYPIMCYWKREYGSKHIYGHMHYEALPYPINGSVCVSACLPYMDYTPRTLNELAPYFTESEGL